MHRATTTQLPRALDTRRDSNSLTAAGCLSLNNIVLNNNFLALTGTSDRLLTSHEVLNLWDQAYPQTERPYRRRRRQPNYAEMGAKQPNDIKELGELAQHEIAILTAIGPQHLETFGSIDNVRKTKYELIDTLSDDGVAFFNYDNEIVRDCARVTKKRNFTYSAKDKNADYYVSDLTISARGSKFTINTPNGSKIAIETKLLGELNILNLVAAVAVANRERRTRNELNIT